MEIKTQNSKLKTQNYNLKLKIKPGIRFLNKMREVLYDRKWAKTAPDLELYYMYRGVKEKNGLRYDITVIPPLMLGKEFVKTMGHSHIGLYSELYIVLKGKAIFLMQKRKNGEIEDVYAVAAKKNENCIIPTGYEHITINPVKKTLKMANWQDKKCQSDYKPIQKRQGACYYYTQDGWSKNKHYKKIPPLRFEKPLKSIPRNLDFLRGK